MKCIVKECDNEVFKGGLCEEHYDPEKRAADESEDTGEQGRRVTSLESHVSLLMHTTLLIAGKIAGKLVGCYRSLFSLSPRERAQILDYVASVDLKKGRKARSLTAFEEAVKLDPDSPAAHFSLGLFHAKSGQFEEACKSFAKALELNPESVEINQAMGEAYYNREDYKSSLKYLRKALKLSPNNEKLNYLIGLAYDKAGSFEKAVKFLQQAVDLNPRCIDYYYTLGFVYEANGQKDEALANFKKAVELEKAKTG